MALAILEISGRTFGDETRPQPAAVESSPGMDSLDDKHTLAMGDRVSFRIVEDRDDGKPLMVTDTGELEIPNLGRVSAAGKTCRQLAREIKAALEINYYHHATVLIGVDTMSKMRGRVYLVGQIKLPGPQEIASDEVLTIGKSIVRAGGFGDFADRKKVRVFRKGSNGTNESLTIDVAQVLEKGRANLDVKLEPDDVIFIPSRLINFQ
jgi:polysaccharide export outer membrane protein